MTTIAEKINAEKIKLQSEIDRANEATQKSDATIHNAIGSLIDGYGDADNLVDIIVGGES